jgi:hypothetical protein
MIGVSGLMMLCHVALRSRVTIGDLIMFGDSEVRGNLKHLNFNEFIEICSGIRLEYNA